MTPEHSRAIDGTIEGTFDQELLDLAAYWIVRLRSDRCVAADKRQFSDWIEAAPENALAFDQVLDTWQCAGFVDANLGEENLDEENLDEENLGAENKEHKEHREDKGYNQPETPSKISRFANWQFIGAMAATLFLAVAVVFWQNNPSNTIYQDSFSTAAGEFAEVTLPDGSKIELNTKSQLKVKFDDDSRKLTLLSGEAYFDIYSDSKRPLIVDLGDAEVTVVGTEFNILKKSDNSHIIVTEGRIKIAEKSAHEQVAVNKAFVSAGQQVNVFKRTGLGLVMPKHNTQEINWRERTLVFQETKLQHALEELNRYLEEPIDASDESLAYSRVSGTFSLEEPNTTLAAIIETFAIQQDKSEEGKTRLYIK